MSELGFIGRAKEVIGRLSQESLQARQYEHHVRKGMRFIRNRQYAKAIAHFENGQIAANAGFSFQEGSSVILQDATEEEQIKANRDKYLFLIEFESMFTSDKTTGRKIIKVGKIVFRDTESSTFKPLPLDRVVLDHPYVQETLLHDVALTHAEEWIHGLLYLQGEDSPDPIEEETQVANYLKKHKVQLTERFLGNYGRIENMTAK